MKLAILLMAGLAYLQAQEILHHTGPVVIHKTRPRYTKEARDAKIEGAVRLSAVIGTDGVPSDVKVERGLGMGLDEKAVECLKEWRFTPATEHFEPVSEKINIEMIFRLSPPESK